MMSKVVKRSFALLLCFIMLFALAACNSGNIDNGGTPNPASSAGGDVKTPEKTPDGTKPSEPAVTGKDTLTVAMSGDNGTLVPSKIMGGFVGVVRQFMEVLVDFKADGSPVWILATDIEEISTSQWIIHCREGITFSNGNKFDANDVWFTFEYYLSDPTTAFFLSCFDLANSKMIDDYTIDLALSSYSIQQLGSLSQIYILDAESFNAETFNTDPIGTGPYVITDYVINSHLKMTANENYWGEKAKIKNLNFISLNEDAQRVNAIQTGLADVSAIPTQDIDYVKTLPGYNVDLYYTVFVPTVAFNMSKNSIMNNLDARLAVCYATDRQAMIDVVYHGYADLLTYPVSMHCRDFEDRFANLHPTYSKGRDLELAKQHAEAAGLVGKDVVVITNGATTYATEAEILQADLAEIGVNVVINNYDAGSYYSISNDPTMYDITLYAVASPQGFAVGMLYEYILWGGNRYSDGWPGYSDYMTLGAAAVANPDQQSRSDMLFQMSQQFVDIVPWFGICDMMQGMAISDKLGGVEFWNSGGMRYVDWYWKA